jgi:hypothetical protein
VVETNSGIILYGNKNIPGKAVFLIQQCYSCPFFPETFVARIPVLMYCIFIYIKFCMNDFLSYPDILTVKSADHICNSGKRYRCAKCDMHKSVWFHQKIKTR